MVYLMFTIFAVFMLGFFCLILAQRTVTHRLRYYLLASSLIAIGFLGVAFAPLEHPLSQHAPVVEETPVIRSGLPTWTSDSYFTPKQALN